MLTRLLLLPAVVSVVMVAGIASPLQAGRQIATSRAVAAPANAKADPPTTPFNFKEASGIAVYGYCKRASQLDRDADLLRFTITKAQDVSSVTAAFDSAGFDGTKIGSIPMAYVYFFAPDGRIKKALAVADWHYLLVDDQWDDLRPLSPTAIRILRTELARDTTCRRK